VKGHRWDMKYAVPFLALVSNNKIIRNSVG